MSVLSEIPDNSRIWVFPCSRELLEEEISSIDSQMNSFINAWHAHKVPVRGAFSVLYRRFLVVAADEAWCAVSGCSTDSLFKAVSGIFESIGAKLADFSQVFWKTTNGVSSCDREEFQKLINDKTISLEDIVFDTTVTSIKDFKNKFEVSVNNSWHGRYFKFD